MCLVSNVLDYTRQRIPVQQWTPETWALLQEILQKVSDLDAKMGQPDCEDPEKAKWMQEVEERLKKLEGKQRVRRGEARKNRPRRKRLTLKQVDQLRDKIKKA